MIKNNKKILLVILLIILIVAFLYKSQSEQSLKEIPIEAPTLMWGDTWYKSTVDKSNILKIVFVDKYDSKNYIETWEANTGNSDKITCYITNDNSLIIAGNGKGKIYANTISTEAFSGFYNVSEIEGIDLLDTSKVVMLRRMFYNCNNLKELDLRHFNTSNSTNMCEMFNGCKNLTNLEISSFDTSNVTNMAGMFYECNSLKSIDLTNFNTSNVTRIENMFYKCNELKSIDLSSFDTSNITTMANLFNNCSSLEKIDLSNFDTGNVISMAGMFNNCSSLEKIDLSKFDTSNVTNMQAMFNKCDNIKTLNIKSFNTSSVTKIEGMFSRMKKLEKIVIGEKFNFNGNGETSCVLPIPNNEYIEGADGKWHTKDGENYIPKDVPNNAANIYYAVL